MNKAIGPASILIAVLTPANAEMVPIASGGQWTAYADTVSSTKDCVVQAAVNGGRFTLSGASDYPGVLRLNLYKPTWRIPRINVPIELSFPDGVNYNFLGTGIQSIVHADISATDVKSFIHHFTADSFATMTLPEGHEAPWQLDLTGTAPTIRAMARCLESAQNWLPLPFPQRPAPIPPQAEQVAPPAPLPVAPKPPPAQATDNNTGPPPVQEPPAVLQPSPQPEESQEDRFMMVVQTFGKSFDDAPNDLLKGAARQKRKAAICSMLDSLLVHGWTGTISDLSSNSAGKGVLTVQIANNITASTANNELSDLGHDTLISADAPFFTALSGMSVGARIVFDGQFFSSDADCIEEMSLMQANSMHEPEFLFRFSDVRAAP